MRMRILNTIGTNTDTNTDAISLGVQGSFSGFGEGLKVPGLLGLEGSRGSYPKP